MIFAIFGQLKNRCDRTNEPVLLLSSGDMASRFNLPYVNVLKQLLSHLRDILSGLSRKAAVFARQIYVSRLFDNKILFIALLISFMCYCVMCVRVCAVYSMMALISDYPFL